jgi:crotonobetainyl-CoA:carnitine CoA-transferase CaiB-like acyl-CoA transferase
VPPVTPLLSGVVLLSPYRVLDLTDHRGQLAGSLLAWLGADVICIEPPDGSAARRIGPFHDDISLSWWAANRGKRSAVVDTNSEAFRRLVQGADVLIETGAHRSNGPTGATLDPAALAPPALAPATLAELNPALVHVTVSPFGSDGPKADWPASDLTVMAAGCQLALTGDSDRAPVRTSIPQAWLHAGAEAACGALLALVERSRSGQGQHVDISAQVAAMMAAVPATVYGPNGDPDVQRVGGGLRAGTWELQFVYPAKDGWVSIMHAFGSTIGPYTARLMDWAREQGHADDDLAGTDWINYGSDLVTGKVSVQHLGRAKAAVAALTATKTKAELFAEAERREILLAPVVDIPELMESDQLAARGYWDEVDDPDLGRVRCPGAPARIAGITLGPLGPAPRLGQHTADILAEPPRQPAVEAPPTPAPAGAAADSTPPLSGVKVVDLTWVYAGPLATRVLADFGATVVKVESASHPDATRGGGPFLHGDLGPEGSGQYAHFNAGKLGLSLNMGTPMAAEVLTDLVRWADIVIESYTPGVMAGWGFDHAKLLEINPEVIALSTCLMGQTGPRATFSGFGNLAGAVTGFYEVTGWPDRAPAGPFLAYTDYISPRYMLAVLLAALDRRRRGGGGMSIDLAQAECSLHFLAPAVVDYTTTGRVARRAGNADSAWAPHGVYPSDGPDEWVAIACETDGHWEALSEVLSRPDLAGLTLDERLERSDDLDGMISAWTRLLSPDDAHTWLTSRGIPAHAVQNSIRCVGDPQLLSRGHYLRVPHPVHESCVIEGPRARLSRTPGVVLRAGPTLGEHAQLVLQELLGYDDDRTSDLVLAGALE